MLTLTTCTLLLFALTMGAETPVENWPNVMLPLPVPTSPSSIGIQIQERMLDVALAPNTSLFMNSGSASFQSTISLVSAAQLMEIASSRLASWERLSA